MATVRIDQIETLSMREKWGAVIGCTRVATVSGLTGTTWEPMYAALDAAGLPTWGDYLDGSRAVHLALVDRDVQMVDRDTARVTLVYSKFNDEGQRLFYETGTISDRNVSGKMQASVTQKRTNLYREGGTGAEQLITVAHTYPATDPDYPGKTITQTGEVDVFIPQRNFTVHGLRATNSPWAIANALVGAVNDAVWLGAAKHQWMCQEVTWEYRNWVAAESTDYYFMTLTFQQNEDTWNPTAVFQDDRTGRPPQDLVEDVGYKYIRYHKEVNFPRELGFFVVGPVQA